MSYGALQVNFYEMVSLSSTSHETRPVIKEGSSFAQNWQKADKPTNQKANKKTNKQNKQTNKQTNKTNKQTKQTNKTNKQTNKTNNMDAQEKRDSFKFFVILFLLQQLWWLKRFFLTKQFLLFSLGFGGNRYFSQ